jgi:hypothetical protein
MLYLRWHVTQSSSPHIVGDAEQVSLLTLRAALSLASLSSLSLAVGCAVGTAGVDVGAIAAPLRSWSPAIS